MRAPAPLPTFPMRPPLVALALLLLAPLAAAGPDDEPAKVGAKLGAEGIPPSCLITIYPTVPPDVFLDCEEGTTWADNEAARVTTYAENQTRTLP